MAIEKKLGTENDPNINNQAKSMEVFPEKTLQEEISDAAQIIVDEENIIVGDNLVDEQIPQAGFYDNLVEFIDPQTLAIIAKDLLQSIKSDKTSRKEWEETYTDGLKYLGMKFDNSRSEPFEGSTGVVHPILAESVTQFQAQAYKEMLPPQGPVKTQIIGQRTPEIEYQADRVKDFMNYYIMNEMKEYDPELDQLLFYLPLAGSAFKKVYYDSTLQRAVSKFIAPEDLIVPYEATDLFSAERVSHVISMSTNEIKKQQLSGFYADIEIPNNAEYQQDEIDDEIDEIQGVKPSYTEDRNRTIYEVHTVMDLEGFEDADADGEQTGLKVPYIITIDEQSEKILAIRRNYKQEDPLKQKINYFIQYKFLPGLGFYGLGLSHMIGGLAKSSTSILRQLIDAGTLANLPAGFKARGMRIRDEASPLQPGEFRDIDTTGGSLKENLVPLPVKEPSGVLYNLLGLLVQSGQRFASIADMNVGDMNQAMPVGTTVALLERGTKVMSAIHKRLHYSQKLEFGLLAKVFQEYLPPVYTFESGSGPSEIMAQDFDDRVDVVPVSDPNIFSQSQRITMAQELLQMVQSNPEIHGPMGIYEAYRRMYSALGIDNIESIIQPPAQPQPPMPIDAGLENAGLLQGMPAQAFPEQNHQAHIEAHRSLFLTNVVKENPAIQSVIIAHIMQHLQFLATQIAQDQMPPEIMQSIQETQGQIAQLSPQEAQMIQQQISMVVEQFSSPILAQLTSEFLQSIGQSNEVDPLVEIRQKELDLKDKELDIDQEQFRVKTEQREQEQLLENELSKERIDTQKVIADDKLNLALQRLEQQADLKLLELQSKLRN